MPENKTQKSPKDGFIFDFNIYLPYLNIILNNINLDLKKNINYSNLFIQYEPPVPPQTKIHEHALNLLQHDKNKPITICQYTFFINTCKKFNSGTITPLGTIHPNYKHRKYSTLLRAILSLFAYYIQKQTQSILTWTIYSYCYNPIQAKAILKYYNNRCIHIEQTIDFIYDPTVIQNIQSQSNDLDFLNSFGSINIYTPVNKENKNYADAIIIQFLSSLP